MTKRLEKTPDERRYNLHDCRESEMIAHGAQNGEQASDRMGGTVRLDCNPEECLEGTG